MTGEATDQLIEDWFPQDEEPSVRRLRKHRLADAVRALAADVLLLDIEAADEDALTRAEGLLSDACSQLAQLPDLRTSGGLYGTRGDASLFERSPLSGRCNALAAPLSITFDGERTLGQATYGEAYEGPPGSVHGGYVIAAFDDLLGVAQAASGTAGFTGTLTVRLVARTPLHTRISYEAGVTRRDGRKVLTWGRSTLDGQVLAEAHGVFVSPRNGLDLPPTG